MGRPSWATDEQTEWLWDRHDAFVAARRGGDDTGTSGDFMTKTFQGFFDEFPLSDDLAPSQNETGAVLPTKEERTQTRQDQIYWWFWNRRFKNKSDRVIKRGRGKHTLGLTPKRYRTLQPYQAYMSLYKDKIMPVVSDRFAEYKATLPEDEEPRKWWPFCMDEVKKLLEAESAEVKAEVEVKRHAAKTSIDWDVVFNAGDNDDDVPITQAQAQQVQSIINNFPKTLQDALESVETQTGWKGSILVGGPLPESGQLTVLCVHQGRTLNLGNNFPKASDSWPAMEGAFSKFVASCFPAEAAEKLFTALNSGDVVPSPDTSSEMPSSDPTPASATDAANAVDSPDPRELDYEEQREQNIIRNRALLASLGPMPELLPTEPKSTKKRGKATAKASRDVVASTDAPSTRSTTRGATVAGTPRQQDAPEPSDKASPDIIMGTETPAAPSGTAVATIAVTGAPPQQDLSRPSASPNVIANTETFASLGTALTSTVPGARQPPTQDAPEEQASDLPSPASSTPLVVEASPSDVRGLSVVAVHGIPTLPGWMDDAVRYFRLVEGGERWTQLVKEWQNLEASLGYPDGQVRQHWLPAKGRPEEIKLWTKNARDYDKLPKVKSIEQYATTWKQWWIALQPASRVTDGGEWPLLRTEPDNIAGWELVRRGGCNGFFLVVISLAWWLSATLLSEEGFEEALSAVDDVSWVCRTLTTNGGASAQAPTSKRAAELGTLESAVAAKRLRTTNTDGSAGNV